MGKTTSGKKTKNKSSKKKTQKIIEELLSQKQQELLNESTHQQQKLLNKSATVASSSNSIDGAKSTYNPSSSCSESEEEFQGWRQKVHRHELFNTPMVLKSKLLSVLDTLSHKPKKKKKPKFNCCKSVLEHHNPLGREIFWDSLPCRMTMIRNCILTNKWSNVTQLLLLLMMNLNKRFLPYVKQMALLNFLTNPADDDGEILKQFLQLCFVKVYPSSSRGQFDIWYKEIK